MNVKTHRNRSTGLSRLIIKVALLGTPTTVVAMGGEAIAGALMTLVFWFIVWFIAVALSLFVITKPGTIESYMLLLLRLSYPVWLAWVFIYGSYFGQQDAQLEWNKNEMLREQASQRFNSLCEQHAPQAAQILKVVDDEIPKHLFIDQPRRYDGLDVVDYLQRSCVPGMVVPACTRLKLESFEWADSHAPSYRPCKIGVDPGTGNCFPEYKRYILDGKDGIHTVEIDQPTSDYAIRVGHVVETGEGWEKIRKFQMTLEVNESRQLLAKTEILVSGTTGRPCRHPVNEITEMLFRVFPRK